MFGIRQESFSKWENGALIGLALFLTLQRMKQSFHSAGDASAANHPWDLRGIIWPLEASFVFPHDAIETYSEGLNN